jgi:hypothetical protein
MLSQKGPPENRVPEWVNRYRNAMSAQRPFIPQYLTRTRSAVNDAKGQNRSCEWRNYFAKSALRRPPVSFSASAGSLNSNRPK